MPSENHEDVVPQPGRPGRAPARRPSYQPPRALRAPSGQVRIPDETLLDMLLEAHRRAQAAPPEEAASHEATIASLECEVAGRGITPPAWVEEPTPEALAFNLFLRALLSENRDAVARAIRHLPYAALWLAYRRIREGRDVAFRIHCLGLVLHRLDLALLDRDAADARLRMFVESPLEPYDLEALAELCLTSMFAVALSRGPSAGGER